MYSLIIYLSQRCSSASNCIIVTSKWQKIVMRARKKELRRLVRTQMQKQRAKMQPLPREVCGKIDEYRKSSSAYSKGSVWPFWEMIMPIDLPGYRLGIRNLTHFLDLFNMGFAILLTLLTHCCELNDFSHQSTNPVHWLQMALDWSSNFWSTLSTIQKAAQIQVENMADS